MNISLLRVQI